MQLQVSFTIADLINVSLLKLLSHLRVGFIGCLVSLEQIRYCIILNPKTNLVEIHILGCRSQNL